MNWINLKEAAKITGKSEVTIRRHLSAHDKINDKGSERMLIGRKVKVKNRVVWQVERVSLIDYYDVIAHDDNIDKDNERSNDMLVSALNTHIKSLENQLIEKDKQINQLQILLLQQKQIEAPRKNRNIVDRVKDFLK